MRRREEVAEAQAREVIELVLAYERLERELGLLALQIETQQLQQAVLESAYRTRQGNTVTMLRVWQQTSDLQARYDETIVVQGQIAMELEQLMSNEISEASGACNVGSSCDRNS
ncbi:MAG: hypothetical protein F6J97_16865 [Leptolyngbya sp. SIO4C1]|nr:hypothetical protein [Leptolyngbya sp. SIO4C1]